jgi:hypothetical protein
VDAVDDVCVPVEIERRYPTAAASDTHCLRQRSMLVGDMHQHPLSAAGIEATVLKLERVRVADPKLNRQLAVGPAPSRLRDQRLAHVHTYDPPIGADNPGNVDHISPGSATEVEHDLTRTQAQSLEDQRLAGPRELVGVIKEEGKEPGILGPVHRREQGHVANGRRRLQVRHLHADPLERPAPSRPYVTPTRRSIK